MREIPESILSKILKKRIAELGYTSLRKFHSDREELGRSYELLRQVVYGGRLPKSETLLRILQALRFGPLQTRKIMELHYAGYVPREGAAQPPAGGSGEDPPAEHREPAPGNGPADAVAVLSPGEAERPATLSLNDPGELAARISRCLQKIPFAGNEDFWEIVRQIAGIAERKAQDIARRKEDQPLLFEKEPEVIYQFLVRRAKIPPYLSRGELLRLEFAEGIDYRDRFRGALLGAAIGETLGRPAQGLSARDVRELYGKIEGYTPLSSRVRDAAADRTPSPPSSLLLARSLLQHARVDPEAIAVVLATAPGRSRWATDAEFAANVTDRGYPWFESGVNAADSAPATWVAPLSLLRAADFRLLKLEAGIVASITRPNAAAISGAIIQAAAVARLLHTPRGSLDVLGFARFVAPAISGIEPDRATRSRQSRQSPTLLRKLGTELAALLLRRAEIEEMQESLGNGPAVQEGLPFAWAAFLRSPESFEEAVVPAANLGNDAEGVASIAGSLCGAYVGASAIPGRLLSGLPWRKELEGAADELLSLARKATAS